jgi:outer membrane protein TolC
VHVADLDRRRIQARGDAAVAVAELNRLMGQPVERAWRAVDAGIADAAAEAPIEALFAEADGARPDVRRTGALEAAARENAHGAARLLVPEAIARGAVDFAGT